MVDSGRRTQVDSHTCHPGSCPREDGGVALLGESIGSRIGDSVRSAALDPPSVFDNNCVVATGRNPLLCAFVNFFHIFCIFEICEMA